MARLQKRQQNQIHLSIRKGSFFGQSGLSFKTALITAICLAMLGALLFMANEQTSNTYPILDVAYLQGTSNAAAKVASNTLPSFDSDRNLQLMNDWRSQTQTKCKEMIGINGNHDNPTSRQQKEHFERDAISKLQFPTSITSNLPPNHQPYQFCRNVFIDLGTNIGDSIGYFMDNAFDVCTPIWMETFSKTEVDPDLSLPHLNVTSLDVSFNGGVRNPLFDMLQQQLAEISPPLSPHTFCVYGMEGNPEFTERLQKLENHIMQTRPRPVQHLHIHTESVVAAVNGPTKLYLDKTSVKENFWGSSILSSQQDVVKSAKELGNGQVFSADVQGISLSTLIKSTLLPYKPDATPEESKGGLLIIKMDVEGAEYQVLKEIAASGVLCDYIQRGNRVVMIVEFHDMSITDPEERQREQAGADTAQATLNSCGVEFRTLHGFWA